MYTENKGFTIWRIIYPILILFAVDTVLQYADLIRYLIVAMLPYADDLPSMMADTANFTSWCTQLVRDWMSNDAMIVTAIRCILLIPLFIVFMNNDNRRAAKRNLVVSVPIWGKEKLNAKMILMSLILGLAAATSFNILISLTQVVRIDSVYQSTSSVIYSQNLPVTILIVGIIGPICEELLFRGLVYRRLRNCFGFIPCLVASSLIFGLFHMNIVQFIYAGLLGACLAYAYEKSRNILIPILMHCIANTGSTLAEEIEGRTGTGLPIWVDIIVMLVGFGLIYLFYHLYPTKKEELVSPSEIYPPYQKPVKAQNVQSIPETQMSEQAVTVSENPMSEQLATPIENQTQIQASKSSENKTEQKNWF